MLESPELNAFVITVVLSFLKSHYSHTDKGWMRAKRADGYFETLMFYGYVTVACLEHTAELIGIYFLCSGMDFI